MRVILLCALASVSWAGTLLPSDARITYVGRFDPPGESTADDKKYFGWAGTQIACRFQGPSIAAQLMGGAKGDRFMAVLDGQPLAPFEVPPSTIPGSFTLAEALDADSVHEVVLWKITEDGTRNETEGVAAFGGFSAEQFLAAPAPKTRRLEFIGDSDTAGYCADGSSWWWSGDNLTKTENTWKTWASQLARDLDADFVAEAISGIGVMDWRIQWYFPNTLPFYDADAWSAVEQPVPDAVLMLIGPNDKSSSDEFINAYKQLMEDVVTMYKKASVPPKIIHVCGGSGNGFDPCEKIQTANDQFNTGRSDGFKGYYTSMTKATWERINGNSKYKGCDNHYNELGHETLKNEIIDQVRGIMDWPAEALIV